MAKYGDATCRGLKKSKVFAYRLYQFKYHCTTKTFGFIPDIQRVLDKYDLSHYLEQFAEETTFPNKKTWKRLVKSRVHDVECQEWSARMALCNDFARFRDIHSDLTTANMWRVAKERPDCLHLMKLLTGLCCKMPFEQTIECDKCTLSYKDELYHNLFRCENNNAQIKFETLLSQISNECGRNVSEFIKWTPRDHLIQYLLGHVDKDLSDMLNVELYPSFLICCAVFIKTIYVS